MKKRSIIIIVTVIAFAFLIAIGFLIATNRKQTTNQVQRPIPPMEQLIASQTNGPDTAAVGCYKTYIAYVGSPQEQNNSVEYTDFLNRCFTESYRAKWQEFIQSTESDPVLLAQDYAPTWETNQQATVVDNNGTASKVMVTLGSGSEISIRTVELVNTGGVWKINSAYESTGGRL